MRSEPGGSKETALGPSSSRRIPEPLTPKAGYRWFSLGKPAYPFTSPPHHPPGNTQNLKNLDNLLGPTCKLGSLGPEQPRPRPGRLRGGRGFEDFGLWPRLPRRVHGAMGPGRVGCVGWSGTCRMEKLGTGRIWDQQNWSGKPLIDLELPKSNALECLSVVCFK